MKITNTKQIDSELRKYIPANPPHKFLPVIYDKKNNCIYEAARPVGRSSINQGESVRYTLANRDSGYSSPIRTVALNDIGYIITL